MKHRFKQRKVCIALVAAIFCLSAVLGEGAEQKTQQPQEAPAAPPTVAFPLAEVATRAAEISNLLQTLNTQFLPSPAIEAIRKQLPDVRGQMDTELAGTVKILGEEPTLETLQAQQKIWHGRKLQTAAWLSALTERAIHLRDAISRLEDLKKRWTETLNAAQASNAPAPVLQQIGTVISAIDAARTPLETQHSDVLDLQAAVSQEVSRSELAYTQVSQAQEKAVGGILRRDGLPVWSAELWDRARTLLPGKVDEIAAGCWRDIRQYILEPSSGMPLHVGLFVAFALLLCAARRRVRDWAPTDNGMTSAAMVFERPYAAALIVSIFVATMPASPVPPTVRILLGVFGVLTMIRLLQPVLAPEMMRGLYVMGVLIALDGVRKKISGVQPVEQAILLLEMTTGVAVLGWSLVSGHLRGIMERAKGQISTRVFHAGAVFLMLDLVVGLVATVLGYMLLARISAPFALGIGILVLALYTLVQVLISVVDFALRVWPLRLLKMVQNHREMLVRRTHRVLVWLAVAAGLNRSLEHLGLLQPVLFSVEALLANKLERGSISISLGDILAFVLTVWAAYLLSSFIRFVLQEDVYPRMEIDRGQSYAASSLLNYLILALGFIVGLGVLGVDLTKVTVLVGALGVGIGFGLQSVVNNFVSGLILLFERPIHVGDTIEVGNLLGEVKRIGIRASTVRTGQGADIIVPNAQLVTDRVTNWTRSDRLRRIDLPVGVNYGAAPGKVIEVLERIARAHPRVLKHPAPTGLFTGFGDSSINFELRAWTDQFADWSNIRSELTVALYDAMQEAGMSFPFPQREVRLLSDPAAGSTTGATTGTSIPSLPEEHQGGQTGKGEAKGI